MSQRHRQFRPPFRALLAVSGLLVILAASVTSPVAATGAATGAVTEAATGAATGATTGAAAGAAPPLVLQPAVDVFEMVERTPAQRKAAWKALGCSWPPTDAPATPAPTVPAPVVQPAAANTDAASGTAAGGNVKADLVGGVGGAGSGAEAPAADLADFYDAPTADALITLLRSTHAGFTKEDPENTRPVFAAKDIVVAAYKQWTGKDTNPCKGDIVQEAVFATPNGCMSGALDAGNLPQHAGVPVLRRRQDAAAKGAGSTAAKTPCTFTNVRCVAPKAAMLTADALDRQIKEQFAERRGEFWFSGRTFAKRAVVLELYKKMYPTATIPAWSDVCANKGPEEFGTDYSAGAWIAIFASDETCLPGSTKAPVPGTKCRRVAVDCVGKPSAETVAGVKALPKNGAAGPGYNAAGANGAANANAANANPAVPPANQRLYD